MYKYEDHKQRIFTKEGKVLYAAIHYQVLQKIRQAGAITMGRATTLPPGIGCADSWEMMACVHRMVELGELESVWNEGFSQDEIFRVPLRW